MAKLTHQLTGHFEKFCQHIEHEILSTSTSATLEEKEYIEVNNTKIYIIAFERYSYTGSNRLSLTVTIVGHNDSIMITGISTGGSHGVIFKINTLGESAFLDKLKNAIDSYKD